MIELLHEFKNSRFSNKTIQVFDNVSAGRDKRKLKVCRTSIHNKNLKFSCILYAYSQFLCSFAIFDFSNRGVRQPVHPHLVYARLLVFDKTLAQLHFSVVNFSDELMRVFYSPVLTRRLIFFAVTMLLLVGWVMWNNKPLNHYELLYRSVGCTYFPPIA